MRFFSLCALTIVVSCTRDPILADNFSPAASCAAQRHCPCNIYGDSVPIRGAFLGSTNNNPRVRVDELLQPGTVDERLLTVGDTIAGAWDGTLPCGGTLALTPEEPVFALYVRGTDDRYPDCGEFQSCSDTCGSIPTEEADTPSEDAALVAWDRCNERCITSTRDACALHREDALLHGTIALARWEDDVLFGDIGNGSIVLPSDSLLLLQQGQECAAALPEGMPAATPCDDGAPMKVVEIRDDDTEGP